MTEIWIWSTSLALLGLIFGSFIATLAVRWPDGRRVGLGRSACDGCGMQLRAVELVPVLSFAVQKGACRNCGGKIASVHPLVELSGLVIGLVAGLVSPNLDGAAGALFGWLLLTLAAIDLRAYWLPNILTLLLALSGLALGVGDIGHRIIGGVFGFAALWLAAEAYRLFRGRVGLGGGDPKMFGAIGCWLGWEVLPHVLLVACGTGILLVLLLRLAGHKLGATDRLPFGTLMAPAAFGIWIAMA